MEAYCVSKDRVEVGWEKWTPKSDKLERRRCQDEEGPARKVYQGIPAVCLAAKSSPVHVPSS